MLFRSSFKRNPNQLDEIAKNIKVLNQKGANNLHVNLYLKDQILFQLMSSKNFAEDGLQYNYGDFSIVHFFNNEKDMTHKTWNKFKNEKMNEKLFYFEKPKGVHIFIQNIKRGDKLFQEKINKAIDLYKEDILDDEIEVEYVDY
ncbi:MULTISPECIES: hypothetical protein [Leeuwenhoekiella]|jgi:hypothetical protein|uniref:hypothetical protein n=1 Tax=Leeuwenhoekiella TaxID=283735 RepID=UPI000E8C39A9|nr:hypothetical protein [Leeuwenhoekiella blandensis]HBT09968.1 hypothetical protein [Leeuwenhoekiella sp.]|tara:strand:- start:1978 stop:2409 length:432 start_codon:yes stop_codon:yes gene_type:complete